MVEGRAFELRTSLFLFGGWGVKVDDCLVLCILLCVLVVYCVKIERGEL